ncbi:putative iron-sulfur-binding oxidoreductase FadF [Paraburkholderia sediminicola]|uniref:Putative iron-sulfur-binding oxidoreductase FadF n=1 Tax=Paraburkholderia sediminicola TaxID=458836 RepID=A0A6J5CXQ7_9BURK|nr:heterodisulfide reductase-related iron-sulfur binding cluster [Paraburkholderia sediminicola]CAB3745598.1 putative iron-sulfur-binding oxidoreductase FadF [Paraburkholderia sediminicola]
MNATLAMWVLVLGAGMLATWRFYRILSPLGQAAPIARFDQAGERLRGMLTDIFFHKRLLKFRMSGVLHLCIFSGFLVLLTAIAQSVLGKLIPGFSLAPVGGTTWIALLQDIFAVVVIFGISLAIWHRYVVKPARFKGSNSKDAVIIYGLVFGVVGSMLLEFATGIIAGHTSGLPWRPLCNAIAVALKSVGVGPEMAAQAEIVFFWIHVLCVLSFLVYIPGSKHRHIFTAIPNIYFRNLEPKGLMRVPPPDRGQVGVSKIEQLAWKDMLDLHSCTECGRCQSVCPAFASGQPLSPKTLIMDMRDHLMETAAGRVPGPLVGGTIKEATLWACTTCRACMDVCPLHIEHVPKIVDMRRQLVETSVVPPTLQEAFANFQRNGNSMGKPPRQRPKWTKQLSFKIKDARKEAVDVLWFVGDFASYDPRVERITVKVAETMHAAGVDFGILFEAEQNSGNDVRRAGEEGLFEMLARANIAAIDACQYNTIMTTDPHSLNALRNEYQTFGRSYPVKHYTEVLRDLIKAKRLNMSPGNSATVTYHDPCYLGRYNGEYDAPRSIISSAGYKLQEMPRCRENSFCCGAGGGRIWGDDTGVVERPSENRIKEALSLGEDVTHFVVSCPKDTVMYSAAVQALGAEKRIKVYDIIDLVEVVVIPEEASVGPASHPA